MAIDTRSDFEFGWDDEIKKDSEFELLPEGDYNFEVLTFERERHAGSDKLPPCNKAVVHIKIAGSDGRSTTIKHNLFLHSRTEGMLCAFFTSIGQRQHGESIKMNWNSVPGSKGRCKVGIRTWKGDNGEVKSNQITKFYEQDTTAAKFEAGKF